MDENIVPVLKPRSWSRRTRLAIIAGVTIIAVIVLISAPRVPLDAHYHEFADARTLFGIPNALDVLSNIPFLIVGIWAVATGLVFCTCRFINDDERAGTLLF